MMPEDRAVEIVWRLFAPTVQIEWFQEYLVRQTRPEWNRAVELIADAIREAVRADRNFPHDEDTYPETPDWVDTYDREGGQL